MSSFTPVVLILGAGANIGSSVTKLFHEHGYRVALAARKLSNATNEEGHLNIRADFSRPEEVNNVFDQTEATFGTPNVVVYNAATLKIAQADSPFHLNLDDLQQSFNINTASVFVAVKRAVQGFRSLPAHVSKTFIYTGNILNSQVMPRLWTLGLEKTATAHVIHTAALAHEKEKFRFYYADERKSNGEPPYDDISGPGHAEMYYGLAQSGEAGPWLQTFVSGRGYTDFSATKL